MDTNKFFMNWNLWTVEANNSRNSYFYVLAIDELPQERLLLPQSDNLLFMLSFI